MDWAKVVVEVAALALEAAQADQEAAQEDLVAEAASEFQVEAVEGLAGRVVALVFCLEEWILAA